MATVKVSERTYQRLNQVAGQLRARFRRPVSVDEALEFIMRTRKLKPSDFAAAWSLTDEEEAAILKGLREFWAKWQFRRE